MIFVVSSGFDETKNLHHAQNVEVVGFPGCEEFEIWRKGANVDC